MSEFPFHVAGGLFAARPTPAEPLAGLLGRPEPAGNAAAPAPSSRRRKLWDIPHKFHCPIVGVCFEVGELRGLMAKVMRFPRDTSDFVLHTTAVGACETRSRLAELLHKTMEKRYAPTVRKFAAARDAAALRDLWREGVHAGGGIPAALWASWTHPACDARLEQDIYGDIHMIQHQVGSGARADQDSLKRLRVENRELSRQLAEARREAEAQRAEKSRETQTLGQRIAELRVELAGRDACAASLTGQLEQLRQSLPDLRDRQGLARRASDAEARAMALTARVADQEEELERLRQLARHAEQTIRRLLAAGDAPAEPQPPAANLSGKCVLCVGGRAGAVDAYRQIVELRGGRFLHHDGGLEESLHRIDAALSAADLVVCQAGCISHNAYWRVKEQCKRSGKQCLFIRGAGVSSFDRIVGAACLAEEAATAGDAGPN